MQWGYEAPVYSGGNNSTASGMGGKLWYCLAFPSKESLFLCSSCCRKLDVVFALVQIPAVGLFCQIPCAYSAVCRPRQRPDGFYSSRPSHTTPLAALASRKLSSVCRRARKPGASNNVVCERTRTYTHTHTERFITLIDGHRQNSDTQICNTMRYNETLTTGNIFSLFIFRFQGHTHTFMNTKNNVLWNCETLHTQPHALLHPYQLDEPIHKRDGK